MRLFDVLIAVFSDSIVASASCRVDSGHALKKLEQGRVVVLLIVRSRCLQ